MSTILFDQFNSTSSEVFSIVIDGAPVYIEATTLQSIKFTAVKLWNQFIKEVSVYKLNTRTLNWVSIFTLSTSLPEIRTK